MRRWEGGTRFLKGDKTPELKIIIYERIKIDISNIFITIAVFIPFSISFFGIFVLKDGFHR